MRREGDSFGRGLFLSRRHVFVQGVLLVIENRVELLNFQGHAEGSLGEGRVSRLEDCADERALH